MAFIRERRRGSRSYWYRVESYRVRVDGRSLVRQRTVYLGTRAPKGPHKGLVGSRRRAARSAAPVSTSPAVVEAEY